MPKVIPLGLLVFILVFSCLAHGTVTLLPLVIIESSVGLVVLFWFGDMAYKRRLSLVKTGLLLPFSLFLGLIFLQLVPLPFNLMRVISFNTVGLYDNYLPQGAVRVSFPLSIYPYATIAELLKIVTYIGIFFFLINQIQTKRQFDLILNTIIILGTLISIFAILERYNSLARTAGIGVADFGIPTYGPFMNRNNFAGYINMVIPLALGYFLTEKSLNKKVGYIFCVAMMSLALFLSLSRAGILVYILTLLFILLFSRFKDSLRDKTKILYVWIAVIICAFVFFTDTQIVWERLTSLFKKETLVVLGHGYSWKDILRIGRDFPLFGTGLGTFGSISSMYKTTPQQSVFTYAHNDYLQLLSETGILGFLFLSLFFIFYFRSVLKIWLTRHDTYVVCLVFGGLASLFGMLVYSFLDFNLHIPANALLFFVILGLVYRLAFSRFNPNDDVSG